MGNAISRTYPTGILKTPKTVSWGQAEIKTINPNEWEHVPLLDTHEIARRTAQIKNTPIVKKPVQAAAPITQPAPMPKPKWTWWQKVARGHPVAMYFCLVGTIIVAASAGPFAALVPAGFLLYAGLCYLYRKHGPQKETVAKAQALNAKLRAKYEHKARAMQACGNHEQAQVYQQLVKRLK